MTDPNADRRAELIAAALVGELNDAESAELKRMRAADPTIDAELAELGGLTGQLSGLPSWLEAAPSDGLRDRVEAIGTPATAPATPIRRPRFGRGILIGVAAAGIIVGAVGGFLLPRPETPPPVGEPGTLGAVEAVDFQGEPAGVEIDGSVVAHTWGTETLLTVNGLQSGEFYSVVVVDASGADVGSGTFLGSEVEINCAVNAATLRESVTSVEIRAESGDVVATAALPPVAGV